MSGRLLPAPSRIALSRGTVAALAALTLAAGAVTTLAPDARAATTSTTLETSTRDSAESVQYVQDSLYAAGDTGYLHRRALADGSPGPYTWRGYDGSEQALDAYSGALPGEYGYYGAGTDVLHTSASTSGQVQLRDMATGRLIDVTLPEGQYIVAAFGSTLITKEYNEVWQTARLHILRTSDGGATVTDIPVDPPESQFFNDQPVLAGDGKSALIRLRHAYDIGLLDLTTGALTTINAHHAVDEPLRLQAALSPTHIAWYEEGTTQARVVRRDDPTGAQTVVAVPQSGTDTPFVGLAGEWLLTAYRPASGTPAGPGAPLLATPLQGGDPRTLLAAAEPQIAQIPGGGAIAVGQSADGGWSAHRVVVSRNGKLSVQAL
ncbi:hypothetical protein H1V43_08060 [Streptomyces sp. PSKA54]|uniref:Uncharacterized protein n=1 Tax=Streptomyces himalayensis subsp. aureolus TaxID=2758039 RepID=A0A7W2HEV9_9ACTN|nr:hypothetical protein [Streptomyces himalayensis]MBA4861343.1 hypothetical protein [Streptomyces himalayensis subsp. aureolus]